MRDTHEAGQSLLDNTQVLIGSNLGDASGHGTTNLPILLAGGGYQHGQHIAGDKENNTPLGKLFVNMLQRFGVRNRQIRLGRGNHHRVVLIQRANFPNFVRRFVAAVFNSRREHYVPSLRSHWRRSYPSC